MTDDGPISTLKRPTLEGFWDDLKWAVGWIVAAVGAPAELAAYKMMLARTRQEILIWLAPIEAMARCILLLAALKEPTPNPAARRWKPDAPIASALRDAPFQELSDHPADWRVLFNDWPPGAAGASAGICPEWRKLPGEGAGAADPGYSAYPLARRLEAPVRLARDPGAAIKRMAKKIAARRGQLCFAFGKYRHAGGPVQTLLDDVQAHVDAALWNTS